MVKESKVAVESRNHVRDYYNGLTWVFLRTGGGRRTTAELVGITVSRAQADATRRLFPWMKPPVVGSYDDQTDLARMSGGRMLSGAYMIESFVHAPDAGLLLSAVGAQTRPGGFLIICDDLPSERLARAPEGPPRSGTSHALAERFRAGWHVQTFLPPSAIATLAARTGWRLVATQDLSCHVSTYRPRDLVARAGSWFAAALSLRGSFWDNVTGGSALQRLIHRRATRYCLLILRREGSPRALRRTGRNPSYAGEEDRRG